MMRKASITKEKRVSFNMESLEVTIPAAEPVEGQPPRSNLFNSITSPFNGFKSMFSSFIGGFSPSLPKRKLSVTPLEKNSEQSTTKSDTSTVSHESVVAFNSVAASSPTSSETASVLTAASFDADEWVPAIEPGYRKGTRLSTLCAVEKKERFEATSTSNEDDSNLEVDVPHNLRFRPITVKTYKEEYPDVDFVSDITTTPELTLMDFIKPTMYVPKWRGIKITPYDFSDPEIPPGTNNMTDEPYGTPDFVERNRQAYTDSIIRLKPYHVCVLLHKVVLPENKLKHLWSYETESPSFIREKKIKQSVAVLAVLRVVHKNLETNPDFIHECIEHNIIPSVMALLSSIIIRETWYACEILRHIFREPSYVSLFVEAEIVPALLTLLKEPNPIIQMCALKLLTVVARNSEHCHEMCIDAGIVETLGDFVETNFSPKKDKLDEMRYVAERLLDMFHA